MSSLAPSTNNNINCTNNSTNNGNDSRSTTNYNRSDLRGKLSTALILGWVTPLVLVIVFLSFHLEMTNTIMILLACLGTVSFLVWILFAFENRGDTLFDKLAKYAMKSLENNLNSTSNVSDDIELSSAEDWLRITNDFKANLMNETSTMKLLTMFRKRMQKNAEFCLESAKHGLLKYTILSIASAGQDDVRIPLALDVINTMLATQVAKTYLIVNSENNCIRDNIDMYLQTANFIYSKNVSEESDEPAAEESEESALLYPATQKKKAVASTVFKTNGYKLVMTIGLFCSDCKEAQTRLGDKGAIQMLNKLLQSEIQSSAFVKWCFWSLIQLVENHPPNKRTFVQSGGIPALVDALKAQPTSLDVYQQGLILLYYILSPDSQTKLNLPEVRQSALAQGIVDVLHKAQRHFDDDAGKSVHMTASSILDILIADWS